MNCPFKGRLVSWVFRCTRVKIELNVIHEVTFNELII